MIYSPGDPHSLEISHGENLCFLLPISALKWLQSEIQPSLLSIPYSLSIPNAASSPTSDQSSPFECTGLQSKHYRNLQVKKPENREKAGTDVSRQ